MLWYCFELQALRHFPINVFLFPISLRYIAVPVYANWKNFFIRLLQITFVLLRKCFAFVSSLLLEDGPWTNASYLRNCLHIVCCCLKKKYVFEHSFFFEYKTNHYFITVDQNQTVDQRVGMCLIRYYPAFFVISDIRPGNDS